MQLYKIMCQKLIKDKSLNKIYQTIEIPAMEALIQIERNGVLVESKILGRQSNELGEQLLLLEKKAFELAGQPFNLSSPKQLQEILFEKLGIKPIKKKEKRPTNKMELIFGLIISAHCSNENNFCSAIDL